MGRASGARGERLPNHTTHGSIEAMRQIEIAPTFDAWQAAARTLLRESVPPAEVEWREVSESAPPPPRAYVPAVARVPRQFLDLAAQGAGPRGPTRWAV